MNEFSVVNIRDLAHILNTSKVCIEIMSSTLVHP